MRKHLWLSLAAAFFIAAEDPDKPKTDLERLQGTWSVVSMEYKGKSVGKDFFKGYQLIFADNTLITQQGSQEVRKATFALAQGKSYKTLISAALNGPKKGKKITSIYTIEGDTLKICGPDGDTDPPTTFTTQPKNDFILIVLKKQKT
jgi:uncharacterized protein (TIGR03067 family)